MQTSKKPTFAHIQEEISSVLDIPDDELDDSQKAAMDAYLDELASQEAAKVDGFAQFVRLEAMRAENLKKEGEHLKARAKAIQNRLEYLKGYYLRVMLENGLKKIQGEKYAISIGKTEAVEAPETPDGLKALVDFDPIFVNVVTEIKPDKKVIKEFLKSGQEVPGCRIRENLGLRIR